MSGTVAVTRVEKGEGVRRAARWGAVLIVLVWSGVCPADVLNPSFETTFAGLPWPRPLPLHWGHTDHPSFNSYCTGIWKTEGGLSAGMFNRIGKAVVQGNFQSFHQFVDLTGIGSIEFDVRLVAYPLGQFEHFEATLLVDGQPLWSQTVDGTYLNQQVKVSKLSGVHRLEMRSTALEGGSFPVAYWTQWDNVRLVEGPTAIPAVIELDPGTLNPNSQGRWITCYIELGVGYDVGTVDATSVKMNNVVDAHIGQEGWATALANDENLTDRDADGIPERMVKFERAAVQAIVQPKEATVTVTGRLSGGTPFEGSAVIRVLDKDAKNR